MRAILVRLAATLVLGMMLGCAPVQQTQLVPQSPAEPKCMTVDGIKICSPFLEYYQKWGGSAVLGAPISGVVMDKGRRLQYFEMVCMEADSLTGEVKLSDLGMLLGHCEKPLDPQIAELRKKSGAIYYEKTGHSLCTAFDGYYQDLGGVELFGYPIAEFKVENGLIVQSFERAKLVWTPQDGLGAVRLAKLGQERWSLAKPTGDSRPDTAKDLAGTQVTGFVPEPTLVPLPIKIELSFAQDVATCPSQQTVVLRVLDANGTGLPGFSPTVIVHENTNDRVLHLPATDHQGIATQSYDLDAGSKGVRVVVRAEVAYEGETFSMVGSYFVW